MITLEDIRTLTPTELRIIVYMKQFSNEIQSSQRDLARLLQVSQRRLGASLRTLEERNLIKYTRKALSEEKGHIILQ